jgi:hypothetical protein
MSEQDFGRDYKKEMAESSVEFANQGAARHRPFGGLRFVSVNASDGDAGLGSLARGWCRSTPEWPVPVLD